MRYFLETEKTGLKKLGQEEATQEYVGWLNDEEVTKTLVSGKTPSGIEDIESFIASANQSGRITFAIYRKDKNQHIGNVKLDHIDWISRKADFGIIIGDRSAWGQGYGYEATQLITDYAFRVLNLNRVYLGVLQTNPGAIHIYKKIGFQEEGKRVQDQFIQGKYVDSVVMGLTRNRWMGWNKKIVAIIQARMSSTRLKGKVLLPLAAIPMLVHIVQRVQSAQRIHQVVVATSTEVADDSIEELCKVQKIPVYRGDLNDVLKRYYDTAKAFKADIVVRITGDCPLADPSVIDAVIDKYLENAQNVDYASNIDWPSYPDGLDVEVFSMEALERAFHEACLASEREHVTLYMRKNMRKINLTLAGNSYSHLRWSVDQEEDYQLMQAIYNSVYKENGIFTMNDVLNWLESHPKLSEINSHIPINEGLKKSIVNDSLRGEKNE